MKVKYALLLLFAAMSNFMSAQFRFNEYSCANVGVVNNPIGVGTQTSPDWIELINYTNIIRPLSGWYLSDDKNNLTKYQVPYYNNAPIKIDSFGVVVIFLDTYDKALPGTIGTQTVDLHTNFQVNQTYTSSTTNKSTVIYLTPVSGLHPTDSIVVQRLRPDHSWGKPNSQWGYLQSGGGGLNLWKLYKTASPGSKNPPNPNPITSTRNWYNGYTPTPKFSIPSGFVSSSQQINLDDTTALGSIDPDFEIFYTTDCTVPIYTNTTAQTMGVGSGGGPVNMPFPPYVGVVVRGLIHDQGSPPSYLDGFEAYAAYVQDSTYHMNVLCTCMDTSSLFINHSKDTVPAIYSYLDYSTKKELFKNQGQAMVKKLDFYNPSVANRQWQFQFRAEDEYGYNYSNLYPFFNISSKLGITKRKDFPEFVVRSASVDNFLPPGSGTYVTSGSLPGYGYAPNHVRDFYNHTITLRHKLDFESSHYTPTYVFINGINKGIYYIKEVIDSTYTNYYYNFPRATIIANDLSATSTPQIHALSGNLSTWNNWYNTVMQASYNVHQPAIYNQIGDSMDYASFIDYNFYNMFSVNTDFVKTQALWWKGIADTSNHASRKWRFGLSNTDMTWGFAGNNTGIADYTPTSSPCDYINAFGSGANNQYPLMPLFYKLMDNDTFKSAFLSRYQDLLNTSYACDTLTQHLKDIRTFIKQDMASQVWWFQNDNGGSCAPCDSVKLWNSFLDSMNIFLTRRCSLAVEGLKNCYNLNGPYNLCVDAAPDSLAGYVQLNTLDIKNFVWNGKYLDSVITTAIAVPDTNYVFDHWETTYNLTPNKYSDTVTFYVDRDACIKAIFKLKPAYETYGDPMLPTAFTPNGDGNNDIMNIYGIANATSYEFEIYNRWGERVFHSLDKTQGWDGTYNGHAAPVGLYAYWYNIVIEGKTYNKKGNFTLLR